MIKNKVFIITGKKGDGKTTKLQRIIEILKQQNQTIVGFIASAEIIDGQRNTYNLSDINTHASMQLCTSIPNKDYQKIGNFYFNEECIRFGNKVLEISNTEKKVVIIDEIGPFELKGMLWHKPLITQLHKTNNVVLISVRESLINDVINKYEISDFSIYKVDDDEMEIIKQITIEILQN